MACLPRAPPDEAKTKNTHWRKYAEKADRVEEQIREIRRARQPTATEPQKHAGDQDARDEHHEEDLFFDSFCFFFSRALA